MARELVSDQVLATWLGVTPRTVRELAERDIIERVGRNKYDLRASVTAYAANLRAVAAGRSAEGDIDLPTERALLARQQRIGQEMKNDLVRGDVVLIDVVMGATIAQYAKVRNKLLALPAKVAQQAAALRQAEPVRALIEREVVQALDELTSGAEGRITLDEARAAFLKRFGVKSNG